MLLGGEVHARAGGEIVGRLRAAVQHDDERTPSLGITRAARNVELVGTRARLAGERAVDELPDGRSDVRGRNAAPLPAARPGQFRQRYFETAEDAFQYARRRCCCRWRVSDRRHVRSVQFEHRRRQHDRCRRIRLRPLVRPASTQHALDERHRLAQAPRAGETGGVGHVAGMQWFHCAFFLSVKGEGWGFSEGVGVSACGRPAPP